MKTFSIITAMDLNNGISRGGELPWYLPADLDYFMKTTTATDDTEKQNALIFDQEAWQQLPLARRPLQDRINIVVGDTPDTDLPDDVLEFVNLDNALEALSTSSKIENIFVMGGPKLFQEAVIHDALSRIYVTKVEEDFDCDQHFPDQIPDNFEVITATEIMEDNDLEYCFFVLERTD